MKHITTIIAALLIAVAAQAQNRVVDNPRIETNSTNGCMEITHVEVNKRETVVTATLRHLPNYWIQLDSTEVLKGRQTGKKYKFVRCENFQMNTHVFMPESGQMDIKLFYEPIDKTDTEVDFSEGSWSIKGISLVQHPMAHLLGEWEKVDEAGNVALVISHDKIFYADEIWNYDVERKGRQLTVSLSSGGTGRQFLLEEKKNGRLLLKVNSKDKGYLLTCESARLTEAAPYSYNPQSVSPLFFAKGKAFIKGYIANRAADAGKYLTISYREQVSGIEHKTAVEVNADGTFLATVEIPYPCYVSLQGDFFTNFFLVPGETAVCRFDAAQMAGPTRNLTPQILGNSLSAQVNRHTYSCDEALQKKDGFQYNDVGQLTSIENALKFRDIELKRLERLLTEGPDKLAALPISDRARDILMTNAVTDILCNTLDIAMFYNDSRYEKVDEYTYKEREDFVSPIKGNYYDYLLKHYDLLMDNMLMLSSSNTWVPFNRAAFGPFRVEPQQMDNRFFSEEALPHMADSTLTEEERQRKRTLNEICNLNLSLLDSYNAHVLEYVGEEPYDSLPTLQWQFNSAFDNMQRIHSFNSGFLPEASIVGCELQQHTDVDAMGEFLIALLPHLKSPIVIREALNAWRALIRQNEGGVASDEHPEVTQFLSDIRKKYDTPLIVLDFWGLGCGPCRASMTSQSKWTDNYAGKATFLYICNEKDNPEERVQQFFTEKGIKGESLRISNDLWLLMQTRFNFSGIPYVALMGKDGSIVEENIHVHESLLDKHLAE